MPEITSKQIKDGQVKRADLNTATSGSAVISKIIAGKAIELASSSGADTGTGDVTIDLGDGTDLFWNDSTKRLGIRTGTPAGSLHVNAPTTTYAGVFQSDQSATAWDSTFAAFNLSNANATTNNHIIFSFSDLAAGSSSAGIGATFTDRTNHYADIFLYTKSTDSYQQRFILKADGKVGIGTLVPSSKLEVRSLAAEIGLIVQAAASQTANLTEWRNSSGTLGAHITSNREFHNTGGGTNSLVIGSGAGVDGDEPNCTSIGVNAICYGDDAVAIGFGAIAGGNASTAYQDNVAIGSGAASVISSGVAIGKGATTGTASGGTAIGASSSVTGSSSVAIGSSASVTGAFGVAIGQGTTNTGSGVTIGRSANGSFAIGYAADSSGHASAIAMGTSALASALYTIAIGASASATHGGSICIGQSTTSTAAQQLVIGSTQLGAAHINNVYIGNGVTAASPVGATYNATGGSGTDIAGASITIAGGKGTGNAAGGEIVFQTSNVGASGTTLQSLTTKLKIDKDGQLVTELDPNAGSYFATSTNKLGLEASTAIWLNTPSVRHPQATTYNVSGNLTYATGNASTIFNNTSSTITYGNRNAQFSGNRIRMSDALGGNTTNYETTKFRIYDYTATSSVSGTISELPTVRLGRATATNTTTATTFTTASTLQIDGPPIAGTNATLTETLALWVQLGTTRFDADLHLKTGIIKFDSNKTTGAGTVSLASSNSSVAVTFDSAMDDTNYVVAVEVDWQTSFWVTNKSTTGFTINIGSPDVTYSRDIGWSIRPR